MILSFPNEYTFGTEIEYTGVYSGDVSKELYKVLPNWTLTNDVSLRNNPDIKSDSDFEFTGEVKSPILHNTSNDLDELNCALSLLNNLGAKVNETCGGHIHFGYNNFLTNDNIKKLVLLWIKYQDVIYKFSSGKYTSQRPNIFIYADLWELLEEDFFPFFEKYNAKQFVYTLLYPRNMVYRGLNLFHMLPTTVFRTSIDTMEFRQFAGTLDYDVWINNINMIGCLLSKLDDQKVFYLLEDVINGNYKIDTDKLMKNEGVDEQKVLAFSSLLFDNEYDREKFEDQTFNKTLTYKKR